jgi:hypothetical protein
MKTDIQLNEEIIFITKKIKEIHPELLKFISEMPILINYTENKKLDLENLQDYYNSLVQFLNTYSISHK